MGRRLSTYVHVDGVAYGPDDELPDEVAEKITAPHVWAEAPVTSEKPAGVTAAEKPARRAAAPKD